MTLPHEHLLLDLSCLWHQPRDPARALWSMRPLPQRTRSLLLSTHITRGPTCSWTIWS